MFWKARAPCATLSRNKLEVCHEPARGRRHQRDRQHRGRVGAYVPSLQRTEGQPPPIAANGGLSYMSFDRDGDAGTTKAIEDALAEIASGESQRVIDMIDKAPPGPIKTRWGLAFRDYDECVEYIRESNSIKAPEGGVALPLAYTVLRAAELLDRPVQRPVARPGARRRSRRSCAGTRRTTGGANLYFPQVLRDARRIGEYYPGLSPEQPRMHGPARRVAGAPRIRNARTSTIRRRWSACSTPRSRSSCSSSSPARPMPWSTTTTSSTRTTRATARKTRTTRTRA